MKFEFPEQMFSEKELERLFRGNFKDQDSLPGASHAINREIKQKYFSRNIG